MLFSNNTLLRKLKVGKKKTSETAFHSASSVARTFMPDEELQIYTKLKWSYKNVHLPRESTAGTKVNHVFESFNKSRQNFIG